MMMMVVMMMVMNTTAALIFAAFNYDLTITNTCRPSVPALCSVSRHSLLLWRRLSTCPLAQTARSSLGLWPAKVMEPGVEQV